MHSVSRTLKPYLAIVWLKSMKIDTYWSSKLSQNAELLTFIMLLKILLKVDISIARIEESLLNTFTNFQPLRKKNEKKNALISLNCAHLLISGKVAKCCMYLTKKLLTLRLLIPKTCIFKRSPKRFLNFWVRLQLVEGQKSEKKSIHNRVLRSKFEIEGQFCIEG